MIIIIIIISIIIIIIIIIINYICALTLYIIIDVHFPQTNMLT